MGMYSDHLIILHSWLPVLAPVYSYSVWHSSYWVCTTHTQCAGGHWFTLNCQLFWKLTLLLGQIFIVFVLKFAFLSLSLSLLLVFAMFGMLSPASRGALMTASIVLFMFMG